MKTCVLYPITEGYSKNPLEAIRKPISFFNLLKLSFMFSITPEKSIQDIQQEFTRTFPFLKVEFSLKGSGMKKFMPSEYFLNIRLTHTDGKKAENRQINITPGITIKELKEKGEEVFGVSIRVYRKFRNIWLESTITEHLTLQQQNDHLQAVDTCYA